VQTRENKLVQMSHKLNSPEAVKTRPIEAWTTTTWLHQAILQAVLDASNREKGRDGLAIGAWLFSGA
jgi:hypothetical protein